VHHICSFDLIITVAFMVDYRIGLRVKINESKQVFLINSSVNLCLLFGKECDASSPISYESNSIVNLLCHIFHQFCLQKINICISFEIRFAPFLTNTFSWIRYICLVTPNICLVMLNTPFLGTIIHNDCLLPNSLICR